MASTISALKICSSWIFLTCVCTRYRNWSPLLGFSFLLYCFFTALVLSLACQKSNNLIDITLSFVNKIENKNNTNRWTCSVTKPCMFDYSIVYIAMRLYFVLYPTRNTNSYQKNDWLCFKLITLWCFHSLHFLLNIYEGQTAHVINLYDHRRFNLGILTLWNEGLSVLSVLFRYTDFDYPFGIFKLFLSGDGQQFHQYQQSELSSLTLTHWKWTHNKRPGHITLEICVLAWDKHTFFWYRLSNL
jgi:hypothetical protein